MAPCESRTVEQNPRRVRAAPWTITVGRPGVALSRGGKSQSVSPLRAAARWYRTSKFCRGSREATNFRSCYPTTPGSAFVSYPLARLQRRLLSYRERVEREYCYPVPLLDNGINPRRW